MQAFGEYWVQYTAKEGYGEIMDMGGNDLPGFMENFDNVHTGIKLILIPSRNAMSAIKIQQ
ncbi:MAG: hypothetical protein F6K14_01050 [Symploca sp. SIO2C1]|nr:hypothetical protein [Symploca sp. SIO2C1]